MGGTSSQIEQDGFGWQNVLENGKQYDREKNVFKRRLVVSELRVQ